MGTHASSHTHPDILSVDKQLRHLNVVVLHAVSNVLLVCEAHKNVSLLEFHHERPEDLLHRLTFRICRAHDAHAGGVEHNLAAVSLFVVLKATKSDDIMEEDTKPKLCAGIAITGSRNAQLIY